MAPAPNPETANPDTIERYYKSVNVEQEVVCLMLSNMSPDLQRTLENLNAYDMLKKLKTMFEEQAKQELFEAVKVFHACKQEDGQSISSYLLKMKSYLDTLERLGFSMPNELGVSLILNSLNKDYNQFVQNYNMHSMGKTVAELHAMLKLYEKGILKKAKTPAVLAIREGRIQKDKNKQGAKGKDKGKTKLTYALKPKIPVLPKRDNSEKDSICHHCKKVDGVFYFIAIPRDGIYEIDMQNIYPNVSSIYNVSNKRAKHALDSTYIWHCHLGHINKKHTEKLQRDGILQPTDNESFEKCKSCISRKMARKPFPHQVERAKELLGLIHADVCGPFRIVSREDASYFITFTDEFNRHGYVYLMKHKHEVFEAFKVFHNEVENQLKKKIKVVWSDRGGEYLSHEFIDHMKSCGIVSQHTPPYTPQHNGVFERMNRTLLEKVRFMMNSITLHKSFWGYALESAACILNMVLNKKVIQRKGWDTTSTTHTRTRSLSLIVLSSLRIISIYKKRVGVTDYSKRVGVTDLNEPPIYKAALSDPKSDKWLDAMNAKMQSMKDNQVWRLVDLPPNGRTIRSKWLFKKKTDIDGNVHTFKGRLVAKSFTHTYSIDYGETFSPVTDIRAIRILLVIATFYDYEIWK
ncbi:retrotransposon protein, putative, ty1-copia subclass [Tanacetum coccineum]